MLFASKLARVARTLLSAAFDLNLADKSVHAILIVLVISPFSFAGCLPFSEAAQHLGETRCVKGKVIRVDNLRPGFALLSFCDSGAKCGFSALVATPNTKALNDLQELQGTTVKIHGLVKDSNGSAQIELHDSRQLFLGYDGVPSFMKTFDVEKRGNYSAGTSRAAKAKTTTTTKQTATLPIDIPSDAEE
jgi:hypothetical protein